VFLDQIEALLLGFFARREQIYACQKMPGIEVVEMTPDASKVQIVAAHEGKRVYILVKFHEHTGSTVKEAIVCDGKTRKKWENDHNI
jgi:hypothetical protein